MVGLLADSLRSAAEQVLPFVGVGVAAGVIVMIVVWGVRKGFEFFAHLSEERPGGGGISDTESAFLDLDAEKHEGYYDQGMAIANDHGYYGEAASDFAFKFAEGQMESDRTIGESPLPPGFSRP